MLDKKYLPLAIILGIFVFVSINLTALYFIPFCYEFKDLNNTEDIFITYEELENKTICFDRIIEYEEYIKQYNKKVKKFNQKSSSSSSSLFSVSSLS